MDHPGTIIMLKFKVSETEEANGFHDDLIAVSSSKPNKTNQIEINVCNDHMVDAFINLCKQISMEGSKSLKFFLLTTSLWDLLLFPSSLEFPVINPIILHYYFSIPDRVSATCKLETDEFFLLRNFVTWTEESLTLNGSISISDKLERFIYALERLDGFGLAKLTKFDGFWDALKASLLNRLSTVSQNGFLASLFKNLLSKNFSYFRLSKITTKLSKNMNLHAEQLSQLFADKFIVEGILDYRDFASLLVSCTSNDFLVNLLEKVLKIWSNDSWIIRTPFNSQLHYSSCLMSILSLVSPDLFTSEHEMALMNGVQSRLDHSDAQVRLMATCVAEMLNQFHPEAENKLNFGLDPQNEIVAHLIECKNFTGSFLFKDSTATTHKELNYDPIIEATGNSDIIAFESDEDDLSPISSLLAEESGPPKNAKSPLPRFLPDCLRILRSNEDVELVEKVLHKLPETFAASSTLSRQMNAASAFNTLLTISDQFDLKDFDLLRYNSLQVVFLDQIKIVAPEIIENLFKSNKLVLGQKMELLNLISSSAQTVFSLKKSFTTSLFLEHLCFPLIANSVRNFNLFQRSHVMFLEKFLWLQGILLNYSQNSLLYERIVGKYFDLVHLTLTLTVSAHKLIEQAPIQKALLIGVSVVLNSWPAGLPVIQLYPRLQEIYSFLEETVVNGPGFQEDQQLQSLGTSVAMALQNLTDPSKLLQESADQLAFDMKSIKVTKNTFP